MTGEEVCPECNGYGTVCVPLTIVGGSAMIDCPACGGPDPEEEE